MPQARGHISIVQEDRILFVTEDGHGYLLTLAHNTLTNARELKRLKDASSLVEVEYDGEPTLASAALRSVREAAVS